MDTFANYILDEKNLSSKMEIIYYLSKKQNIFFDKSVILKTELARLFIKYNKIDVDENLVLTACLLCNCKKMEDTMNLEKIKTYAKQGSEYLELLGFDKKFRRICLEMNRYNDGEIREKESDVLELVDQFGGMIIDRPDRTAFNPEEAMVVLKYINFKNKYNRYVESFSEFVDNMLDINMGEFVEIDALKRLSKMYNETNDIPEFIKNIVNNYQNQIDKLMAKKYNEIKKEMFEDEKNLRPLFTEETTRKIIGDIEKSNYLVIE